jgi:hypothetical protein
MTPRSSAGFGPAAVLCCAGTTRQVLSVLAPNSICLSRWIVI